MPGITCGSGRIRVSSVSLASSTTNPEVRGSQSPFALYDLFIGEYSVVSDHADGVLGVTATSEKGISFRRYDQGFNLGEVCPCATSIHGDIKSPQGAPLWAWTSALVQHETLDTSHIHGSNRIRIALHVTLDNCTRR